MDVKKERKKGSGGARQGAGRKPQNRVMMHTSINADYLARLKDMAEQAHLTIGAWLEQNVQL